MGQVRNCIVVTDGYLALNNGIKDSLKFGLNKKNLPAEPIYKISGDTLFIEGNKNANTVNNRVFCKHVREFILDHSNLDINDTLVNRLKIKGTESKFRLNNQTKINCLWVLTGNPSIYSRNVTIDALIVKSNASKLEFYDRSKVNYLKTESS